MLTAYKRGRFVHVLGTHETLEKALRRFPLTKPLDLVDVAYWSWANLESFQPIDRTRKRAIIFRR